MTVRKGLFRQQALDARQPRLNGEVLVTPRWSVTLVTCVLLVWLGLVVWFLATHSYARQVTVSGWLEPPGGVVRLFANQPNGRIERILVNDGDWVEAGQILLVLRNDALMADGASLESALLGELAKQHRLLTQQIDDTRQLYLQRNQQGIATVAGLQQDLQEIAGLQTLLTRRLSISDQQMTGFDRLLSEQSISQQDWQNAQARRLALEQELKQLKRERLKVSQTLSQATHQLNSLPAEERQTLADLETRLSDLTQRRTQMEGQRQQFLAATQSGIVSNLQVTAGQLAPANQPLLTIVPASSHIQARLVIPARSAGFVLPGQAIEIRYDAFPYQKFGFYRGEVASVSNTVMLPGELTFAPLNLSEPAYLVQASLDELSVRAYGHPIPLKSGMTFTADIALSERTLMEWLLDPLLSLTGRV